MGILKKFIEPVDMTEGSPWQKIVLFAVPMLVGNIAQQLYNTVDSVVVGNYVGDNALAAVGSAGPILNLLIVLFVGISVGAGIMVSQYFGAREREKLSTTIGNCITLTGIATLFVMIVASMVAKPLLELLDTPDSIIEWCQSYLLILFIGSAGLAFYNILSGVLRGLGDSMSALLYLLVSTMVNIVLDLLFVAKMGMGVNGVALATVIAQAISAFLCLIRLTRTEEEYRVELRKIRFDGNMMRQIISNGLPAGVQNSIIALANVVVQSNINVFGMTAVAGCGAYSKIEGFGFLPITCFALSLTTFISQNLGAKEYERARKGARFGIFCSIITAELVGICIYIFIPTLIQAFDSNPAVVRFGTTQARTVTLFYFLLAFSHCLAGIFRGAGKSIVPMVVMLLCWCVIRITYITVAVKLVPVIRTVFWAYPLTWSLSSIIFLIYFLKADWIHGFERQEQANA